MFWQPQRVLGCQFPPRVDVFRSKFSLLCKCPFWEYGEGFTLNISREIFRFVETDSSSGVEDDNCISIEEENNKVENGSLNGARLNILANQYEAGNNTQDFVEQNAITGQSEVDGVNDEAELPENQQNSTTVLPLNTNITQDPEVWARANNIG